jgi:hypothetical protein
MDSMQPSADGRTPVDTAMMASGQPSHPARIARILPFSDPRTMQTRPPKVIARGSGCQVLDEDGNRCLEMTSGPLLDEATEVLRGATQAEFGQEAAASLPWGGPC